MSENHVYIITKDNSFVVNKRRLITLAVEHHFSFDAVVTDLIEIVHKETGAVVLIEGVERERLRKQLSAIRSKHLAATRRGGRQVQCLLSGYEKCTLVVKVTDINNVAGLIESNKKLVTERDAANAECAQLRAANTAIRQELYHAEQKALRQDRKVTPKADYSERHKRRVKKSLADSAKAYKLSTEGDQQQSKLVDASVVANVLDKENISIRKYHQLASLTPNLPRKHQVQAERKRWECHILPVIVHAFMHTFTDFTCGSRDCI